MKFNEGNCEILQIDLKIETFVEFLLHSSQQEMAYYHSMIILKIFRPFISLPTLQSLTI